jgi:hypothetical protein
MRAEETQFALPSFTILAVLLMFSTLPLNTHAQQNAVIYSGSSTSPSLAFVDATTASGGNICAMINNALSPYNPGNSNGVVVDARGIPSTMLTCTSVNPWQSLITYSNNNKNDSFSNVVLLPSGTIQISTSWILPNNTHLVGEGPALTTITAASTLTGDMIDMGWEGTTPAPPYCSNTSLNSSPPDCPGIVVEHLGLQGNGSVNGIANCCAQELSRVNDVFISNIATGLAITDKYAQNSGPYTNLTMSNVTMCVSIETGTNGAPITRGVHGLTCSVSSTSNSAAAIMVDSPNNSLEDISISGLSSQDGILIGSQNAAQGNVLFNIRGSSLKNVIHISASTNSPPAANNCPNSTNRVCDATILGVTNSGGTTTIQDDLISTTQGISDPTVAMYIVGEPLQAGSNNIGYSRFTSSASVPTWLVGGTNPTGRCAVGDLYSCTGSSCTSGSPPGTVFECVGGTTSPWLKLK